MATYGPYSPIIKAGSFYYTSGQVGLSPATKRAAPTIQEQTSQALRNLTEVLASQDLSLENVIKTTVYLSDMGEFQEMNSIYSQFFVATKPARTTVAVKELPRLDAATPLKIEIEAIAIKERRSE